MLAQPMLASIRWIGETSPPERNGPEHITKLQFTP
jgi:hypothetical protein